MSCLLHTRLLLYIPKPLYALLLSLLLGGAPATGMASDDWVQEKRFNEQMVLAKKGKTKAMYEVGRMYERGRGVKENLPTALDWFSKAAEAGSYAAHARLGMHYLTGLGTKKDYPKAYTHLSTAAKHNIPAAQYYLANMLENGHTGKQDHAGALVLYKKAAAGGFYQASARITALQRSLRKSLAARRAAQASRPKPAPAKAPARSLATSILDGNWHRNGKPAGYLPSSKTKCKKKGSTTYRCRSQILTNKTDKTTITYVTLATLSGFNQTGKFEVSYQNNILRMHKEGEQIKPTDDDDYSALPAQSLGIINPGIQQTKHTLECSLREDKTLLCIKNHAQELEFSDNSDH